MLGATGLRTHIWNNNLKSLLLLAGFPFLLMLLAFAAALIFTAFSDGGSTAGYGGYGKSDAGGLGADFAAAMDDWPVILMWSFIAAGIWFVIAWFSFQKMIDAATGAHDITRAEAPEIYNLLENLTISRGMPMPKLKMIDTPDLNAYASGLTQKQYTVTVTRGLVDRLNKEELEAVLAHELSHIRHKDVRLLVISIIFVGIFSFVAQIGARMLFHGGLRGAGRSRRGGGGNAAVLLLIAAGLVVLAYVLAIAIRFTLSRRREYVADAGAVELTQNPDAMISALQKISGNSGMEDSPSEVREMMIENPKTGFLGLFATHPPIEKRIEALETYAGGRRRERVASVPTI